MSIKKSIGETNKPVENATDWDAAISHAQNRIRSLKSAIKLWKEMKAKGEKWPGFEVSQQQKSPQEGG